MVDYLSDDLAARAAGMLSTIQGRSRRNQLRVDYSESDVKLNHLGVEIPPGMDQFMTMLSWPRMAVTAFAAKQVPAGFNTRSPTSFLDDIDAVFEDNSFDSREREVIEAADELGCSFVFSTLGDVAAGEPLVVLSPRTAMTATAVLDPRTGEVVEALEITGQDEFNLYLPGRVISCVRTAFGKWEVLNDVQTGSPRVQCAVYVHGSKLGKPFGRSRISKPIMDLTLAGIRTLLRQEVAAQFFMHPRFLLLGADVSAFTDPSTGRELSPWDVMMGAVNGLPDISVDDDPDMPDALRRAGVETFQQLSMQPFSDQFRLHAAAFSGESSIPLQYLGVVSDSNPTSAQAIEASEVKLVSEVRAQNPILGRGRRQLALNALSLVHPGMSPDDYAELRGLTARWEDPRTRSMAEQSNMVHQQTQIGNFQAGTRSTLAQLPISKETVEALAQENERAAGGSILDRVLADAGAEQEESLADRARAFNALVRSGATPESAARLTGLEGLEMTPGVEPGAVS